MSDEPTPAQAAPDRADVVPARIDTHWRWHDETNVLLRAAIESANDAIIITEANLDPPGPRIEYVNPAFTAMTGYAREEVLGQTPRVLQGPKTDRALLARLRDDLRHGRLYHGETINYGKGGKEYVVEWRITALRDVAGRVLKWVAIQRDVTERRQAEAQRDAMLAGERAARVEAERAGRLKDEFLSTLSHELRTPLNAILGWAQLLGSGRLNEADARRAVETVVRNARIQSELIDDLLDMSRIMSGAIRLELQARPIAGLIEAAAARARPTAEAKGVRFELVPGDDAALVLADAARLQQALSNLLGNAIKFTPAGGRVEVRTTLEAGPGGEGGAPMVAVHVSDDGTGIAPEFLPHVFDRFRQADASTTRQHGGLGLGLSIVKQLAELHGGGVEVTSEGLGRGSTFTLRLPVASTRGPATPACGTPPAGTAAAINAASNAASDAQIVGRIDLSGVRLLVVDDEPDARAYIRRVLEERGATVTEAGGTSAALAAIEAALPDVLVSDIGMAHRDGYELIRTLRHRADDAQRNLAAIALTAFTRGEDRRRALLAGYQSHLGKPVDAVDLLVEVASLCGRAAAGD